MIVGDVRLIFVFEDDGLIALFLLFLVVCCLGEDIFGGGLMLRRP